MTYAHRDSNCCFPVPDDNAFNALRFGFCLVVIIMHCLARSQTLAPYARFFDGHLAVCAFFILSGFWVTKSYRADERPLAFYRKRAQRLLPLYYMTVVGCAVLLACVSTLPARAYFSDRRFFAYLFWNGIFLNFMQPSLPGVFDGGAVNGSLWTIKVEISFYLILPLLVALLRRLGSRRKQNLFLAALYVLSVAWNMLLARYAESLHVPQQLSHQLPGFLSCFVSGMAYTINGKELRRLERWLVVPSLVVCVLHYSTKTEILLPFALTVVIFFAATHLRFLARVGKPQDYSYGMYLFHFPIMQVCASCGFFASAPRFCIGMIVATTLGMAFVAEKYVQERIRKTHAQSPLRAQDSAYGGANVLTVHR